MDLQKRIEQLAKGKVEYRKTGISFSEQRIELEVPEGEDFTGEFSIFGSGQEKLRGILYSSSNRMECQTRQFDGGEEVRIGYRFCGRGLTCGDVHKGEFTVVCSTGEYSLSFVVYISGAVLDASTGKIKGIDDFTRLAEDSYAKACRMFYTSGFRNILRESGERERILYEAVRKEPPSGQKVECYLTSIGAKKPVCLKLDVQYAEYYGVTGDVKEQIVIRKNMWGYISGTVSSDAAFLEPEKEKITGEDFLGSACYFVFYIREDKLHAGNNFGRICFDFPGQQLCFTVCCSRRKKREEKAVTAHAETGAGRILLMRLYTDYRLNRITTGAWAKESIQVLEHLLAINPSKELYGLMRAQALLFHGQKQEAGWILKDYKKSCTNRLSEEWGYYLYLCTLMEREGAYVDRLSAEIEALFLRNPESSLLFWILLFIRKEYFESSEMRLKAIERWVMKGNTSPCFYLEAFYLLRQEPHLLTHMNAFEKKVLYWAARQKAITEELALQIVAVVARQKEFDRHVYKVLCACYEIIPTDAVLTCICSYLIKGQRLSVRYHKWFALGIKRELRITNLYEAFLSSMDPNEISDVPKMIQMYFRYQSSLSYRQLAVLFVNIIAARKTQEDVYQKYRRTIEQFAMEQLEAEHIDENLAVIYNEMLKFPILNEELAGKFSGVLFTHKLACKHPHIDRAVIVQKQWKEWQTVSLYDGTAYFYAYTKDYIVLLFDSAGNVFADPQLYYDEALFCPEDYLEYAMGLAPQALPYLVYAFSKRNRAALFRESDEVSFSALIQSEQVNGSFKAALLPEIIRYFAGREYDERLEWYLLQADYASFSRRDRRYLIKELSNAHLFDHAFRLLQMYGYDFVDSGCLVSICSYRITTERFKEDDFLVRLSYAAFCSGKYNDVILEYLCRYYCGPVGRMAKIWREADKFDIKDTAFEERILIQMLYCGDYLEGVERIYESYCSGGGREKICLAYLTFFSHLYLALDAVVPTHVFLHIEERYLKDRELNDSCGLGLLKSYAEKKRLTKEQLLLADRLLSEYCRRNICFSFFRDLDESLNERYLLYDKFYAEYHTSPSASVTISYCFNGRDYEEERMREVYPGIFTKGFLLLFGDEVQYYISEEPITGEREVLFSDRLCSNDVYGEHGHSRYALLNDMFFYATLKETKSLKKCMEEYQRMQAAAHEIFPIL